MAKRNQVGIALVFAQSLYSHYSLSLSLSLSSSQELMTEVEELKKRVKVGGSGGEGKRD